MYRMLLVMVLLTSCAAHQSQVPTPAPEKSPLVYHIQPDPALDDPHFTLCNVERAYPYYGVDTRPTRDKRQILDHFKKGYTPPTDVRESGFISIRFMVNCMGVAGRFRITSFDDQYAPMNFDNKISSQLLTLTKEIKDWEPLRFDSGTYDAYCYFLFKIEGGQLIDVLP